MHRAALLSLVFLTLFTACEKKAAPPAATKAPEPAPAVKVEPPPASTEVASFGVAECDDYIKRYLECVNTHVPEASRVQVRAILDQTRSAWQQAASTEAGRAGLAAGCKQATEMARTSMAAYGCTF